MKLSGEFKNRARCTLAMTPAMLATIASVYATGPSALIPAVVCAAIAYPLSRWVGQLGHNPDLLTRMEPTEKWKEIAKNIGFRKVPPVYRLEDDEHNAHAGYGNVVMKSDLLDYSTEEDKDFVFAHELGHIKRCDGRVKAAATYSGMLTAFTGIYHLYDMIFFSGASGGDAMMPGATSFLAFTAAACATIPLGSDKRTKEGNHEMEFDCDARAVKATGDIDAGIDFFEARLWGDERDDKDSFTHPSRNARIAALKAIKTGEDSPVATEVKPSKSIGGYTSMQPHAFA